MNIGELITALNYLSQDTIINNIDLNNCGSDRGSYEDFCIGESSKNNTVMVKELKDFLVKEVIGKTFRGYKGGSFEMDEYTRIKYGFPECSGAEIDGLLINETGVNIKVRKILYY